MERRQLMMNGSIHAFFEGEGVRVDTNVDGELDLIVITAAIIGQFKASMEDFFKEPEDEVQKMMEEMIKIRRSPEDEVQKMMEEMIKIRRSPEDEEIEFREDREPIFS